MGGPALRCAAGKSNRARCFQRVALSRPPFFFLERCASFLRARCASREPVKQLRGSLRKQSGSRSRQLNASWSRVVAPSQPRRNLEWRLGAETGPSYAVSSSVSRDSNGAIACYICAALPPFMPPPPAGHAATDEHRGGSCALDELAGGGELEGEASVPLRAWGGALPTWRSIYDLIKAVKINRTGTALLYPNPSARGHRARTGGACGARVRSCARNQKIVDSCPGTGHTAARSGGAALAGRRKRI